MKLVFPNGEHKQVELPQGETVVGSDPESDVQLDVKGIAAGHARITVEPDGTAHIKVDNAANITRVNGSLVVARTPVKAGDALLFGTVQCQVAGGDSAPAPPKASGGWTPPPPVEDDGDDGATKVRMAVPQYVLRGVSGGTFGKHFPIRGTTIIGRHSECDVCLASEEISRKHAKLVITPDGLYVEDLGSANGTFVNGQQVRREKIEPGDELKLDTVRFLIQAPGQDTPKKSAAKDDQPTVRQGAVGDEELETEASGSSTTKWAIIITVLIAAAIAGLKFGGII
ncbi:MAG: FHA domain-containing protein [Xanthomonadales bacterium]|nr:FHA domain-containing protein [Xanthomonadales bacterium]